MKKVSASDAARLRQLETRLGSRLVRTVLGQDKRIMSQKRLGNLQRGTGKLSPHERDLLDRLSANAQSVERLSKKQTSDESHGRKRKPWKVNRSIRDWLDQGKERDAPRKSPEEEQKAIRGLRFLGIDPSEKTFYLRKVAT